MTEDAILGRDDWRSRLRALPVLTGDLRGLSAGELPPHPLTLLERWLDEAIVAGVAQPHVAALATAGADGAVGNRMLIVKDLTAQGVWFSSSSTSPKGADLAADPRAALTLYWRESGRQVRVTGTVSIPSADVSAHDFRERSVVARREMLVDRQSAPRVDEAEATALLEAAQRRLDADPETVAPAWSAYLLAPERIEFWAAATGRAHDRFSATPDAGGGTWRWQRLWT
ncbi:pyridoxal 5'-phosphate synthase [Schumannella luteola]|uniref:Pyridoxamine 5'-phosphate oxidase n=1 Tax=Schumannella luteola TaxID=472059 RepID=A0A852YAT9_9MICO|nr:pyridoxal 5'-phosphate synthase [Schumannella luteola]NYG99643.1 pyridoxamine 5'-phosphate oxidase [Schumannella luteola]TPX02037.1 pyridoxal 5'-phosphate synthase [Schumannella luteola]